MPTLTSRTSALLRSALTSAVALSASSQAYSQQSSGFYKERFERVRSITQSMVNDLANATLDSACMTSANFQTATASLDATAKATAVRMREAGIRSLNETKAWNTCKSQREQANRLAADMSGAAAWSTARADARRSAMLAENEEVVDGVLVDHATKAPVTSEPRLTSPINADLLLDGRRDFRESFDAVLTVSDDGLVTGCDVVSSTGNQLADVAICRRAQTLMRYRPAFADGRMITTTTRLRLRLSD